MKNSWLALVFVVTVPGPALADPIIVRSGEHSSFTRLVLQMPEDAGWSLETLPGRSILDISGFNDGFDLSGVFDVIPRTRLTALLAQASTLELQLACDCPVEAFLENNGYLVLDIGNGPAIDTNNAPAFISSALPESNFSSGELLWANRFGSAPESSGLQAMNPTPIATGPTPPSPASGQKVILETQERLMQAFSEAASRGVLSLQETDTMLPADSMSVESPPEIFDSSEDGAEPAPYPTGQIRITSSKDIPDQNTSEQLQLSGAQCPREEIVAVSRWGKDQSFNEQMRQSYDRLFDALGRLQKDALIAHVRLNIFFGFGAEAISYLNLAPEIAVDFPELLDIANILEYGHARNPRLLHQYAGCDSDVALWAILAAKEIPMEIPIQAGAALRALQSLPSSLRFIASQGLSDRLLQRGDIANAGIAMRSYQNLQENDTNVPRLADAAASGLRGNRGTAKELLNDIIEEDTPQAPDAIISLVDTLVENDKPVPADIALLAEAYAFEFKNTQKGTLLYRAHVLAAAKSGQYEKAIAELSNKSLDLPQAIEAELANYVFSELANNASDVQFLETYFAQFKKFEDQLSNQSKLETVQRLFVLGFTEDADLLNARLPKSFETRQHSILTAKLHLRQGRFSESIEALGALSGEDVAEIKAHALEKLGENQVAAEIFDTAQRPDRAVTNLWLSEQWSELIEENDSVFGVFSQLTRESAVDVSVGDEMLSNSRAAISSSAQARASLQSALNALRVAND